MKLILLSTLTIGFSLASPLSVSANIPSKYNLQLTRKIFAEFGQPNLSRRKLRRFALTLEDIDTYIKTLNFDHLTESKKKDLVECSALLHSAEETVLVNDLKTCYGFRTFKE